MRPAESAAFSLQSILETDRAWTAYALADLFPPWNAQAQWLAGENSAVLIYHGLEPPILFAHGEPAELDALYARLPRGDYWFTIRPTDFARLKPRLQVRDRTPMWRMWWRKGMARPGGPDPRKAAPGIGRLRATDLAALTRLYRQMPDGPDAFSPEQLANGVYFGVEGERGLLSAAGTHVICRELKLAAVGNVATDPAHRGRGLGQAVSQAVVGELIRQGTQTIVLNARMDNPSAIRLYRKLGFMPYCGFYEGRASIDQIRS